VKVWIIFVRIFLDSRLIVRYIDSQWCQKESARERKSELEAGWKTFGCLREAGMSSGANCEITEASVVDVKVVGGPATEEPPDFEGKGQRG
jgi:hypothetical protein